MRVISGELASREAAAQAGVDRSTIMASRTSAKDGAIAALQAAQALRLGRRRDARGASELARLAAPFDWAGPPPVRPRHAAAQAPAGVQLGLRRRHRHVTAGERIGG